MIFGRFWLNLETSIKLFTPRKKTMTTAIKFVERREKKKLICTPSFEPIDVENDRKKTSIISTGAVFKPWRSVTHIKITVDTKKLVPVTQGETLPMRYVKKGSIIVFMPPPRDTVSIPVKKPTTRGIKMLISVLLLKKILWKGI